MGIILSLSDGTTTLPLNETLGQSTTLVANCNALESTVTIDVAAQIFNSGDYLSLGIIGGTYELMRATNNGSAITGGFRYTVTRNVDGGGLDFWFSGSAVTRLGSGIITTSDWQPESPAVEETSIALAGDGDAYSTPTWRNVTETIPLMIVGPSALIVNQLRLLEQLMDKARENRMTWNNTRLWLNIRYDHDSSNWRSQVLGGRIVATDVPNRLTQGSVRLAVVLTRRYYWEGDVTALPLSTSSSAGATTTDWATVYNNDDATPTQTNWFQVAAGVVKGTVPAPLKIEISNNSGAQRAARVVYLGNYTHMDPLNVDPIYLGSAAVGGASASGNNMNEWATHRWLLPTALLEDVNGQYVRVIMCPSAPLAGGANAMLRAALQVSISGIYSTLVSGELVLNNGGTMDLGALPLPPGGAGVVSGNLYLALMLKQSVSATNNITVDWIQFLPAGEGLYRRLSTIHDGTWNIPNADILTDDGPENAVYVTEGGVKVSAYRGVGHPLMVWPGATNRMRMIIAGEAAIVAGTQWQVKASYRPRRLSV